MVRMSPTGTARLAAGTAALLLAAAACGGSNDSGGTGSRNQNTGGTVSAKNIAGVGSVLVDSSGKALYFAEQETDGTIRCTKDCLDVWLPLTVPDGQTPKAGSGVSGTLGTVTRPDGGGTQVTLDGKPLYRFSFDKSPDKVTGEGAKDTFGGTDFVWHVATTNGVAPSPTDNSGGIYNY
jgi:predicted lipoprotein with Yx(FWY)xxD motif